ncbi:MAG TPA: DNA mismatch repair endonuclease MutL [Candidatus Binataceae bacterium]|nr:DNA mismatch repair endonuclease MutL [Candidatus Binataceae bacterium]
MDQRLIHILPEQVASQIAAGEVVERPASAIKELVENSLDAGARSVSVEVEGGGQSLIAVADDGAGMSREDAILSIRRHATSKIRDAADLSAIRTLGFRGEALAAIASVSRLTLRTRPAAAAHALELRVDGGEIGAASECALGPGTRIEVRELFFNTPARLKFLKTRATEQAAIAETIQRLALANHAIAFRFAADGRIVYELPRAGSLLERFRQLFGERLAAAMLPFELLRDGARVHGLVAQSQSSFPSPRMIFSFVNRRAVRDRMLMRTVAQAYQTLLPRGRHPAVALFVELRPELVDVNVHPMKTEVRFRNSGAVFELCYRALRDRLADQREDTARAAVGSLNEIDIVDHLMAAGAEANFAPGSGAVVEQTSAPTAAPAQDLRPAGEPRALRLVPDSAAASRPQQSPLGLGYGGVLREAFERATPAPGDRSAAIPQYSSLKILGQLFAGYIVLEGPDGFILVDQHAAHERVTFEQLRAQMRAGGVRVQAMLTPVTLELNPARAALIQASLAELGALGFELEAFGPATLLLKGAPAVFGAERGLRLLSDMIESLGDSGLRAGGAEGLEEWLKQLACHGSIRVGRSLERAEIGALLADLDRTEFKTNCPHGRPVHIRFGRGQIERMFRR